MAIEKSIRHYLEGYAGDEAARFLDIPVATLRRRLHDGRIRFRQRLTRTLETSEDDSSAHAQLQARVRVLLSTDAPQSQWYDVTRELLLTLPIPFRLLTDLLSQVTLLDVRVEKDIPIGGHRRLAAFVDIFNLLVGNAEQNANWSSGSSFLRPLTIVPPRLGRVGAKLEWCL